MVEALVNFFRNIIPGELTVFILSMMPIIELRGGLVAAKMLGVDLLPDLLHRHHSTDAVHSALYQ